MNAKQLYFKQLDITETEGINFSPARVYYCSNCRLTYLNEDSAEKCCKCIYCGEEIEKNKYINGDRPNFTGFRTYHQECFSNHSKKLELEQIKKAEKLDECDGYVFWNDEYYSDISELIDYLQDNEEYLPEYVFCCDLISFEKICPQLDYLIEGIEENGYEGISENLNGWEDLQKAFEVFKDKNKGLVAYYPNCKKMVKVPKTEEV